MVKLIRNCDNALEGAFHTRQRALCRMRIWYRSAFERAFALQVDCDAQKECYWRVWQEEYPFEEWWRSRWSIVTVPAQQELELQ